MDDEIFLDFSPSGSSKPAPRSPARTIIQAHTRTLSPGASPGGNQRTGSPSDTRVEDKARQSRKHNVDPLLCKPDEFLGRIVCAVGAALQVVVQHGAAEDAGVMFGRSTSPSPDSQLVLPVTAAVSAFVECHRFVSARAERFAVQLASPPSDLTDILGSLSPSTLVLPAPVAGGRVSSSQKRRALQDFARASGKLAAVLHHAVKADTPYARHGTRTIVMGAADRLGDLRQLLSLSMLLPARQANLTKAVVEGDVTTDGVPAFVACARSAMGLVSGWLKDDSQPGRRDQVAMAVLKHLACRWSKNPFTSSRLDPAVAAFTNTLFGTSRDATSSPVRLVNTPPPVNKRLDATTKLHTPVVSSPLAETSRPRTPVRPRTLPAIPAVPDAQTWATKAEVPSIPASPHTPPSRCGGKSPRMRRVQSFAPVDASTAGHGDTSPARSPRAIRVASMREMRLQPLLESAVEVSAGFVEEATKAAQAAGARAGSSVGSRVGHSVGQEIGEQAAAAGGSEEEARAGGEAAGRDEGNRAGALAGAEKGAAVGEAIAGEPGRVAGAHAGAKTGMVAGATAGGLAGAAAAVDAWKAATLNT